METKEIIKRLESIISEGGTEDNYAKEEIIRLINDIEGNITLS